MDKKLKIKIIIIGGGVLLFLCVLLLFVTGGGKETANAIDSYQSARKDEARLINEADYWLNYDEKTSGSRTGTLITEQTTESGISTHQPTISDVTDDEDLLLMQTQQQIRNSNLENKQQAATKAQAGPPPVNTIQPSPSQATQPLQKVEQPGQRLPSLPEIQDEPEETNRFYRGVRKQKKGNTVSASVYGDQTLMQGSTIKIRLLEDLQTVQGQTIPKGTPVWGVVNITRDRMLVTVSSILLGKDLVDVNYTVYDIDGQQGINLPANVKAEIARRAEARSIQNAPTDGLTSDGGILEKSAGAVVGTAKNILSRKAEEVKVKVKSNYQIVLK